MAFEELEGGWVCRLVPTSGRFPPDSTKPQPQDFYPSSEDKAEAKARGIDPLVSVWDEERCSLDQAKAIFARPAVGFGLSVQQIREVRIAGSDESLSVLRDPLTGPRARMPGAEGHCGIRGLKRLAGVQRLDYKRMCLLLSDLAEPRG